MTQVTQQSPCKKAGRSLAWPEFEQKLGSVLESLEEDQFLIISIKRSNRYVQFAAQGSFGIRAETTSNSYLAESEKLDSRQVKELIAAGWKVPTGTPGKSTRQADPDGSPNFYTEFAYPVSFDALAKLTVQTFTEIYSIPHPGDLEYEAFNAEGVQISLTELGLRKASRRKKSKNTVQRDNVGDGNKLMESYPYKYGINSNQISQAIEQLRLNGENASWIVFIFNTAIQSTSSGDQCINLQYSVANGVVGMDWVLLGERNRADQRKITKFIRDRQHKVRKLSLNNVSYLRVEEGDLIELGLSIVKEFYQIPNEADITLLAERCVMPKDWQPKATPLTQKLLATVRATTGLQDLDFDEDGDIGVRYGTAMTYLRLIGEPQHVHIFCPILRDVEESAELFIKLNELNANQWLIRFFFRNGVVYGAADLPAEPLVVEHIGPSISRFCAIVDGTGSLLQAELGGQTAFIEFAPSLLRH